MPRRPSFALERRSHRLGSIDPNTFRPSEEFEGVLHFAFYKGFNRQGALDAMLCERILYYLEIPEVCVLSVDGEFAPAHREIPWRCCGILT